MCCRSRLRKRFSNRPGSLPDENLFAGHRTGEYTIEVFDVDEIRNIPQTAVAAPYLDLGAEIDERNIFRNEITGAVAFKPVYSGAASRTAGHTGIYLEHALDLGWRHES